MPWESVRTVAPRVAFDAVFMTAASLGDAGVLACELEDAGALACEDELEPLELLPHAARASEAASEGRRNFRLVRIGAPLAKVGRDIGASQRFTNQAVPIRLRPNRIPSIRRSAA
jgi:hypothetical protein